MLFLDNQPSSQKKEYEKFLRIVGSLSNLFGSSEIPYLYYRVAEKIFCSSFQAVDLSRGDLSVDASKEKIGVGLKTFLMGNSKTFQKIAEFNSDRPTYQNLKINDLVKKISELRNARINFACNVYDLDSCIYHCVIRDKKKFMIYEEVMNVIDINNIQNIKETSSSIFFQDGKNEYSFLKSKSTLAKRFNTNKVIKEFEIRILSNPLKDLEDLLRSNHFIFTNINEILQTIYLPLYGRKQVVFPKSGLNQWNAGGRLRDLSEVYIPVPSVIKHNFRGFFPNRDAPFALKLPNGKVIQAKICQDGDKALMSYSNKELGQWILRDVLSLREGEVLTYEKLMEIGIDSVRIDKMKNGDYEINFSETDTFEKFVINL